MITIILKENVLSDDALFLSDDNKVFKGGFIAFIKYYQFASAWCDKEFIIKFRKENQLQKYLKKHYPDFEF